MTAPSTGRKADHVTRHCGATNAKGEPCKAWALRESDPPRCARHAMTDDELRAHLAKAGRARQHKRRVQSDASESRSGITPGVSLDQILQVCIPALGATYEFTGEPDWGARLTACAVLLAVFPRSLRTTPEDARARLHALLDGTEHEELAERDPLDHYRAMRREWFDTRARFDKFKGLYVEDVPPLLLGPGETRSQVMKTESPNFDDWSVRDINSDTHVLATDPQGTEHLVPRTP